MSWNTLEQPSNLPPSYRRDMDAIWREIRKLQRGGDSLSDREYIQGIFSWSGEVTGGAAAFSPPYVCGRGGGLLVECLMVCGTTASTDSALSIKKNGVAVGTASLAASIQSQPTPLNLSYTFSDIWQVAMTSIGTGLADLSVFLRYK